MDDENSNGSEFIPDEDENESSDSEFSDISDIEIELILDGINKSLWWLKLSNIECDHQFIILRFVFAHLPELSLLSCKTW